jgi:hypothetical protein
MPPVLHTHLLTLIYWIFNVLGASIAAPVSFFILPMPLPPVILLAPSSASTLLLASNILSISPPTVHPSFLPVHCWDPPVNTTVLNSSNALPKLFPCLSTFDPCAHPSLWSTQPDIHSVILTPHLPSLMLLILMALC